MLFPPFQCQAKSKKALFFNALQVHGLPLLKLLVFGETPGEHGGERWEFRCTPPQRDAEKRRNLPDTFSWTYFSASFWGLLGYCRLVDVQYPVRYFQANTEVIALTKQLLINTIWLCRRNGLPTHHLDAITFREERFPQLQDGTGALTKQEAAAPASPKPWYHGFSPNNCCIMDV